MDYRRLYIILLLTVVFCMCDIPSKTKMKDNCDKELNHCNETVGHVCYCLNNWNKCIISSNESEDLKFSIIKTQCENTKCILFECQEEGEIFEEDYGIIFKEKSFILNYSIILSLFFVHIFLFILLYICI